VSSRKKFTKSPDNLNRQRSYKSPDLKRRRGWRNNPPKPYNVMKHDPVAKRGGYEETEAPLPIEEYIEHIEENTL